MTDDRLSHIFFALSARTRRDVLTRLAARDATVKELAEPYDISLAAVSKHLKVLESAGLISRRKNAQFRPCHFNPAALQAADDWLADYRHFWDRSLDRLTEYLRTVHVTSTD
jgi:DNA-binding transcriptional ArsR family regulator